MPECPHCRKVIDGRYLRGTFSLKAHKTCPFCARLFTVDVATKYRQAIGLVIALASLGLTLGGTALLIPAIISYAFLGLYIYWGNKRVVFVPYKKGQKSRKDT